MLPTKRFKIVNEGFRCVNCGKEVPPTSGTTPRNHCPYCLTCLHVDINPGDRANPCKGILEPIGVVTHTKKTYIILHECSRCGKRVGSKAILTDKNAADDMTKIIELSSRPIKDRDR